MVDCNYVQFMIKILFTHRDAGSKLRREADWQNEKKNVRVYKPEVPRSIAQAAFRSKRTISDMTSRSYSGV